MRWHHIIHWFSIKTLIRWERIFLGLSRSTQHKNTLIISLTMTSSSTSTFYQNKVVVVTGGGSGIGKALCHAFAEAGANVVVADLKGAQAVKDTLAYPTTVRHAVYNVDVTDPTAVSQMITKIKQRYGKIDIYCSNAGIMIPSTNNNKPLLLDDSCTKHSIEDWNKIFQVNVLSHLTALRELLPDWKRGTGDGHFCVTASAAGLLTMVGDASYGVSKAAALSFCEHVAISHQHEEDGVKVHCLCPQAVDTPLVATNTKDQNAAMTDGVMSPEAVAEATLKGIQKGDFFIFPHPEVPKYALRKAQDHTRWLKGMQRLRNKLIKPKLAAAAAAPRSKL